MSWKIFCFCLILPWLKAYGQNSKITILKEKKIIIANYSIEDDPNNLPILTFTILNKTKEPIIFNRILLNLSDFKKHPTSSSSNDELRSKVLTPIAGYDIELLPEANSYIYGLSSALQIISKDAATVRVRLYCNRGQKHIVPSQIGYFKFFLEFITYDNKGLLTKEISL